MSDKTPTLRNKSPTTYMSQYGFTVCVKRPIHDFEIIEPAYSLVLFKTHGDANLAANYAKLIHDATHPDINYLETMTRRKLGGSYFTAMQQANHDDNARIQLQKDYNAAYNVVSHEDKDNRRKIQQDNLLKLQKMRYQTRSISLSQIEDGEFVFITGTVQETIRLVRTTLYDFPFLPKSTHA